MQKVIANTITPANCPNTETLIVYKDGMDPGVGGVGIIIALIVGVVLGKWSKL